eukprot:3515413-Rhodomonas_salina.1
MLFGIKIRVRTNFWSARRSVTAARARSLPQKTVVQCRGDLVNRYSVPSIALEEKLQHLALRPLWFRCHFCQ